MTHVLVVLDNDTQLVDLAANEHGHISLAAGLETCVLYSLHTDRRARAQDEMQDDPRGWWAEQYSPKAGDRWGSHIWVQQAKGSLSTEGVRKTYLAAHRALSWMLEVGMASDITLDVQSQSLEFITFEINITRPDGGSYQGLWDVYSNAV